MPKSDAEALYKVPQEYEVLLGADTDDLDFYLTWARVQGGPVLDLACGTGRVSLALAREGTEVWGLDSEAAMLDLARERGLKWKEKLHWVQGDLRSFDLGRSFPLIVLPYNGLQHLHSLADLNACFERINYHAAPGTILALDLHLPQPAILARDPSEWFGVDRHDSGLSVQAERSSYDPLTQVLTQTWKWTDAQGAERISSLALRQFYPQEIQALLLNQGWALVSHHGAFDGSPLSPSSLKQVIVARRL